MEVPHKNRSASSRKPRASQAGDTAEKKVKRFVEAVKALNARMSIPDKIEGIRESDIPLMASRALSEANPLYPVPRIFGKSDMHELYARIMAKPKEEKGAVL
jgi:alcohol dehydrogenase class IV